MKKLLSFFIIFTFLSTDCCLAYSELYYFKNIKTGDVEPIVNSSLDMHEYDVIKQNPYYALSKNGNDRVIIILQQSGENMFYYYNADNSTKVNKTVLREIKHREIVCEQSFNTSIIDIYDNLASGLLATQGEPKKYTFEDETEVFFQPEVEPQKQKTNTLTGYIAKLEAGTTIPVYLQNSINTATAAKGDQVTAVISDNVIYNGVVVIPQGSLIYGTLTTARNAAYGSRNGRVVINFTDIVTPENNTYKISAETIDFTVSNDGKISGSVKSAAVKAAAGAAIGLLFALLTDSHHVGRSAAIGAGVGAGSAIILSAAEKGVDAEIPSFTEMELTLKSPLSISVSH